MFILTIIQMAGVAVLLLRVWLINLLKRKKLDLDRIQLRMLSYMATDRQADTPAVEFVKSSKKAARCHTWLKWLGASIDEPEMDLKRYEFNIKEKGHPI